MKIHSNEVSQGLRFEFGDNWAKFLRAVDDGKIGIAKNSLQEMLDVGNLERKSFLDVGSGSGLFSLAACQLGARVTSFDYDPRSVACTAELRRRYGADTAVWDVAEGSVLDPGYLQTLGTFDIVYSWGVLHHTGCMWDAFANIVPLVAPGEVVRRNL